MDIDPKDLSEEELDEALAVYEEIDKLGKTLYVPHAKQRLFHQATNTVRTVLGGNRSGKSEMGINEVKMHATGVYPSWYPESKRWMHPTRGRIMVNDYKKAGGEVIVPKLEQWFEPQLIIKKEHSMGNLVKVHIRHVTGGVSTFDIMTYEQDTKQCEGWNGHYVWFDEPPPRDKYIACLRGLVDFEGRAWITATPISEPWLFDEIMSNPKQDHWHIAVSTFDNPYLTEAGRKILLGSITPEEEEARIYGKFLHLSGRIYSEFDTSLHLVDNLPNGHHSWPVYFVLDPADRRPHHAIWAKIDPMGTIYVFDELVFKGTIDVTCEEIKKRERSIGIQPDNVIRILDPNKGQTPSNVTGLRLVDEFAKHGIYLSATVNDDIALGHLAVKERLGYRKNEPISTFNSPKLFFVKALTKECVKQLLSYVWEDWRGRNADSRTQKETPKDINKDMPDCIRYLCMSAPIYIEPSHGNPQRFTGGGRTGWGV